MRTLPVDQNFFTFMQILGENGQSVGWRPSYNLAPFLGNPGSATVNESSLYQMKM